MEVFQARDIESRRGERFTGTVWMEALLKAQQPGGMRAYRVFFAPGARTHWHAHQAEQILYVLEGSGRVQQSGSPGVAIGPGDVVLFGPGEKHWHGAGPTTFMAHLAVTTGGDTVWMEEVTEEEYGCGFD